MVKPSGCHLTASLTRWLFYLESRVKKLKDLLPKKLRDKYAPKKAC